MPKICAENERIKREYQTFQREGRGRNEKTIDQMAAALARFEAFTRARNFKAFKTLYATEFKHYLLENPSDITGKPRSRSTISSTLHMLRDFFLWLADRPGYKSRLSYPDAEYFNLTAKDERIAHAAKEARVPSLEDVTQTLEEMPSRTAIEMRDCALIALTLITGARISALRTLRLKHVEWDRGRLLQDAREVETKNSKTIITPFFPISEEAKAIVGEWIGYLRNNLHRTDEDALFPRVCVVRGQSGGFEVQGLERGSYASDGPIRDIFKRAFTRAGVTNYR